MKHVDHLRDTPSLHRFEFVLTVKRMHKGRCNRHFPIHLVRL